MEAQDQLRLAISSTSLAPVHLGSMTSAGVSAGILYHIF